jgi:parvulin-like peptidyl-prolyl isomerase
MLKRILIALIIFLLFGCNESDKRLDINSKKIVAKVNNIPIYLGDVYRRIEATYGEIDKEKMPQNRWNMIYEMALESEIIDKLLFLEAQKEDLLVTEDAIKDKINKIKESIGEENYKKMLKDRKSTEKDFEQFVKERELIELYKNKLFEDIKIDEETIKNYYLGHKKNFVDTERVKLEIITTDSIEKANEIFARLQKGEDFEKLSKEFQINSSEKIHWRLRPMPYSSVPEDISAHLKNKEKGEILPPLSSGGKVYIIKIIEKFPSRQLSLDDVKEEIRQLLISNRQQSIIDEWYQKKMKEYNIEYINN